MQGRTVRIPPMMLIQGELRRVEAVKIPIASGELLRIRCGIVARINAEK